MQKMGRHIPKMSRGLYILENVWYDNQDVTITGTRSSGDRAPPSGGGSGGSNPPGCVLKKVLTMEGVL